MKFVDAKCPNCGGEVKLAEGSKTGKCQNCGCELQVATEVEDRITRAFDLISQKKHLAAEKILNETALLDAKNGQVYFGLLLCDLGINSPELLTMAKFDYSNNPNYIRACQFLGEPSKRELEQCCAVNKANLVKTPTARVNTPLMQEFAETNMIDDNFTLIGLFVNLNFNKLPEEEIIVFYKYYGNRMQKLIELFDRMSVAEKNNIEFFDPDQMKKAVDIYMILKEIMDEYDANVADSEDFDDYDEEA